MLKIKSVTLFLMLIPTMALADLWCAQSYRFESFSFGVANGIVRNESRPKILDEMCFRLGVQYAQELKRNEDASACATAFNEGSSDGREGRPAQGSIEHFNCYQAGHQYGLSKLSVEARAKNINEVGQDCVEAYARGKNDGENARVATLSMDEKVRNCYLAGHNDGVLFPGLL